MPIPEENPVRAQKPVIVKCVDYRYPGTMRDVADRWRHLRPPVVDVDDVRPVLFEQLPHLFVPVVRPDCVASQLPALPPSCRLAYMVFHANHTITVRREQ